MAALQLLDGRNLDQSTAEQVMYAIQRLSYRKEGVTYVTDANGNHIERIKLFQETLSDGSKALTIELHFADSYCIA